MGTEAINLTAVQEDISGTSIIITWDLPSSPAPTASGFTVMYETSESSETCTGLTERSLTRQGLMTGSTYSISIITQSTHLPSGLVGPVNVTLGLSESLSAFSYHSVHFFSNSDRLCGLRLY